MKYKKGTFVVVPNIQFLKGKPSAMQTIFLWLCVRADDNGKCFPMRTTIAEETGCDIKTVDKYITQLVEEGFISKTERKTKAKRQNSNLYQILLINRTPKNPVPSTNNGASPNTENGAVTISNELYPLNSCVSSANEVETKEDKALEKVPYSFIGELTKLRDSPRHDMKVIALYWASKGFVFQNEEQFKAGLKRELRAAQLLKGYSGEQIAQAIDYCKRNYDTWTLETVSKRISDLINKR